MTPQHMTNEQYQLLFGVRRSMRYHERRRAFLERLHRITSVLTILMAGSVLFDLGRSGDTSWWLSLVSVLAALMAGMDMVVGYSKLADVHHNLKTRFGNLEMEMLTGNSEEQTWQQYLLIRLSIEQDEPPIFRALDLLCHNELLAAEGISRKKHPDEFSTIGRLQRFTCHVLHWQDLHADEESAAFQAKPRGRKA